MARKVLGYGYHQRGGTKHHTWDECPEGKLIPDEERERGKGGLPKCETCRRG
jgi:hypothetical protein